MKLSRPATVFAAVTFLAAGTAVGVSAAIEATPVKLCSSIKTSAVMLPSETGACPKGTTAFLVASDSDVRTLAERLETAEANLEEMGSTVQALSERVAAVEPSTLEMTGTPYSHILWFVEVRGTNLEPGSTVTFVSDQSTHVFGTVTPQGTFEDSGYVGCSQSNYRFVGTGANGAEVSSDTSVKGPGCP